MKQNQHIFIGLLGGITAGLMMFAALRSGAGAFILMFFAPAAVYLASMGWGSISGFIAGAIATAICFAIGGFELALVSALMIYIPAAWIGHLTNLAQSDEETGQTQWFPLSGILAQLALLIGIGAILSALTLNFSMEAVTTQLVKLLEELSAASNNGVSFGPEQIQASAQFYAKALPFIIPPTWLVMHTIAAYVSAKVTHRSERLARPIDDIAATLTLPNLAIGFLIVSIAGVLVGDGMVATIATVILGLVTMALAFVGLADLHLKTRGNNARTLILIITYVMIVLFYIPIFFFAVSGLFRMVRMNQTTPDT